MAEITNVSKLIINYLTEEQYQTAKASGLINENELYIESAQTLLGVAHPANHPPSIITQDANNRFVTDAEKAAWNGKQAALTFDSAPTASSTNPVTSGGVKTALDAKAPSSHTHTKANITDFPTSMTPTAHNQAASTITAGTLAGQVVANATAVSGTGVAQVRNIYVGTADMTAGTTALSTGDIYFMYE